MKKTTATCLSCSRQTYARGLCRSCYATFRNHVNSGKLDERYAEKSGIVLPSKAGKGPFSVAMSKAGVANGKVKR